jgi:hypothetical protein
MGFLDFGIDLADAGGLCISQGFSNDFLKFLWL